MVKGAGVMIVAVGVLAATAAAAGTFTRSYVDALYESNAIESHGVNYNGRLVPVDNAACIGLRRFGVRTDGYGSDRFWRFRCTVSGADNHGYDVQTRTQTGPKPRWVYTLQLTIRRLY